jgi:hypothetical protein
VDTAVVDVIVVDASLVVDVVVAVAPVAASASALDARSAVSPATDARSIADSVSSSVATDARNKPASVSTSVSARALCGRSSSPASSAGRRCVRTWASLTTRTSVHANTTSHTSSANVPSPPRSDTSS